MPKKIVILIIGITLLLGTCLTPCAAWKLKLVSQGNVRYHSLSSLEKVSHYDSNYIRPWVRRFLIRAYNQCQKAPGIKFEYQKNTLEILSQYIDTKNDGLFDQNVWLKYRNVWENQICEVHTIILQAQPACLMITIDKLLSQPWKDYDPWNTPTHDGPGVVIDLRECLRYKIDDTQGSVKRASGEKIVSPSKELQNGNLILIEERDGAHDPSYYTARSSFFAEFYNPAAQVVAKNVYLASSKRYYGGAAVTAALGALGLYYARVNPFGWQGASITAVTAALFYKGYHDAQSFKNFTLSKNLMPNGYTAQDYFSAIGIGQGNKLMQYATCTGLRKVQGSAPIQVSSAQANGSNVFQAYLPPADVLMSKK